MKLWISYLGIATSPKHESRPSISRRKIARIGKMRFRKLGRVSIEGPRASNTPVFGECLNEDLYEIAISDIPQSWPAKQQE